MNIQYKFLQYDIDLELKTKLTIVGGDSGTGKTFLAETIKAIQEQPGISSQVFIISSQADLISLNSHKEPVVIVDKMEQFTTSDEILEYIRKNSDRWFIIFLRGDNSIPFGLRNLADLSIQEVNGLFRFRFNYLMG